MTMKDIVGYIRVSTEGQHESGLGEDAQRRAITEFAAQHNLRIVAEYADTASGAVLLTRRPGLNAAINDARKRKCKVVVAKLDRLSRSVHFISGPYCRKRPVYRDAVRPGRRPVHAAHLRRSRAKRTRDDLAADKGRAQGSRAVRPNHCASLRSKLKKKSMRQANVACRPCGLLNKYGVSRQAIYHAIKRYKKVRMGQ